MLSNSLFLCFFFLNSDIYIYKINTVAGVKTSLDFWIVRTVGFVDFCNANVSASQSLPLPLPRFPNL
jgi:hypothetical protein